MPTPPHAAEEAAVEIQSSMLLADQDLDDEGEILDRPQAPAPKKAEPVKVKTPLNVIATRSGYYKQSRKVEGDKFTIEGEHQLGHWMKII